MSALFDVLAVVTGVAYVLALLMLLTALAVMLIKVILDD